MRTGGEPVSARLSGRGVDRIPERAEAIDVAPQVRSLTSRRSASSAPDQKRCVCRSESSASARPVGPDMSSSMPRFADDFCPQEPIRSNRLETSPNRRAGTRAEERRDDPHEGG